MVTHNQDSAEPILQCSNCLIPLKLIPRNRSWNYDMKEASSWGCKRILPFRRTAACAKVTGDRKPLPAPTELRPAQPSGSGSISGLEPPYGFIPSLQKVSLCVQKIFLTSAFRRSNSAAMLWGRKRLPGKSKAFGWPESCVKDDRNGAGIDRIESFGDSANGSKPHSCGVGPEPRIASEAKVRSRSRYIRWRFHAGLRLHA